MMRTLVIAASLFALGACAAAPNPDVVAAQATCAAAYGDPALDPIRARIPLEDENAVKAPMSVLSDSGKPSAAERAALQYYDAANRRCWDAWDKTGTSPYIQQARAKVSAALARLYRSEGTYGDFNRQRATAISEMQAALQVESERARYGSGGGPFSIGVGFGVFR